MLGWKLSQQTKQDGDLEDSYHTHFAEKVLCPNSIENKIEEPYKEKKKTTQSNPLLNGRGQSSVDKGFSQQKFSSVRVWQMKMFFKIFSFPNHKIYIKGGCLGLSYAL